MELFSWMSLGCHPARMMVSFLLSHYLNSSEKFWMLVALQTKKPKLSLSFISWHASQNWIAVLNVMGHVCKSCTILIFPVGFSRSTKKGSTEKIHYSLHSFSLSVKGEAVIWVSACKHYLTFLTLKYLSSTTWTRRIRLFHCKSSLSTHHSKWFFLY